jgi:cytochrome c553
MKRQNRNLKPGNVPQADEAFDPWEQSRPIPLFVIAVVFALALWGMLTYGAEYMAQTKADRQHAVQANAQAGSARVAAAALPDTSGLANGDSGTLALVAVGRGQAWSCASCHGAAGEGNLTTPRLAGQPADYLKKQLHDFASGLRVNESMALVARALTDDDMDKLARYYAGIELRTMEHASLGGDMARGAALAKSGDWKRNVPACFSCHGANGEGVAPGFPALAGQKSDYIFAQLAAWHAGERKNSPQALMDGIARNMSPQDMRSVADYLGSLPAITPKPPANN